MGCYSMIHVHQVIKTFKEFKISTQNAFLSFYFKVTEKEINRFIEERENIKDATLALIEQHTKDSLEAIQREYKTAIETSTGFGYIAAIAICFLLSLPLMVDIHKLITKRFGQNKVHNQHK